MREKKIVVWLYWKVRKRVGAAITNLVFLDKFLVKFIQC